MKKGLIILSVVNIIVSPCNPASTDNRQRNKTIADSNTKNADSANKKAGIHVLNTIELHTKGVTVSDAYLIYSDNETLVPRTNATAVGRPVSIRLLLKKGWKEKDRRVSIGASEKIETDDGQVITDVEDLFRDTPSIAAADANAITLKATITSVKRKVEYFTISFRIWDKNGTGEITGRYKLYVK